MAAVKLSRDVADVILVGLGGFGNVYVGALLEDGARYGARLIAGVDPHAERAERVAALRERGVPIYPTLVDALANHRADLVVLATPIHFHARDAVHAVRHGACVLVEKPVAGCVADAHAMQAAAESTGCWVAVGFQWSFAGATQRCKQRLLAGEWGKPRAARGLVLWPRRESYYRRNSWAGRRWAPDGVAINDNPLSNATAHFLHHLLFLLGETPTTSAAIESITAKLWRVYPIETFDSASVHLRTRSGVSLEFNTSHATASMHGPELEIHCERGVVSYAAGEGMMVGRRFDGEREIFGNPDEGGYAEKMWQCVDCLRNGRRPALEIAGALPHLELVDRVAQLPVTAVPVEAVTHLPLAGSDVQCVLPDSILRRLLFRE